MLRWLAVPPVTAASARASTGVSGFDMAGSFVVYRRVYGAMEQHACHG
jgi:hypothetical protein